MHAINTYLFTLPHFLRIPFIFWFSITLCGCSTSHEKKRSNALIGQADLKELIQNPNDSKKVVLIDLQDSQEYNAGHIPNALNMQVNLIKGEAFDSSGSALKKELEITMGNLGIKWSDEIIIYDNKQNTDACRLWWLLTMFGHEKVRILDGGIAHWKESGNTLNQEKKQVKPVEYHFKGNERKTIFASVNDVMNAMHDTNTVLLDVRSLEEYDGTVQKNGASRAGHIEGCSHLEFKNTLTTGGENNQCFKTAEELRALFTEKGITPDKKIIVYCHSGTRSAHTTFVLTELLGYKNVSNYDGSWVEWSNQQNQ